jgi:hypothetical protein
VFSCSQIKEGKEGTLGAKFKNAIVKGVIGGLGAMVGQAGTGMYNYFYADHIIFEKKRQEVRYHVADRFVTTTMHKHVCSIVV